MQGISKRVTVRADFQSFKCAIALCGLNAYKTETLHARQAGDTLYTASMKPIMSFLEDSGPGVHDTTAAACSYGLYVLQIGEARPASCMICQVDRRHWRGSCWQMGYGSHVRGTGFLHPFLSDLRHCALTPVSAAFAAAY